MSDFSGSSHVGHSREIQDKAGVVIWQPEVDELWVRRTAEGKITERDVPALTRSEFEVIVGEFSSIDTTRWGPPTYFDRQTFVDLRRTLIRDGVVVGVVATGISLSSLSSLIGDLAIEDLTPFILFGDDKVLAQLQLRVQARRGAADPGAVVSGSSSVWLSERDCRPTFFGINHAVCGADNRGSFRNSAAR
jgi:hypothetical protein